MHVPVVPVCNWPSKQWMVIISMGGTTNLLMCAPFHWFFLLFCCCLLFCLGPWNAFCKGTCVGKKIYLEKVAVENYYFRNMDLSNSILTLDTLKFLKAHHNLENLLEKCGVFSAEQYFPSKFSQWKINRWRTVKDIKLHIYIQNVKKGFHKRFH